MNIKLIIFIILNMDNKEINEIIEDLPEVSLDHEDKSRIIKGLILIFLFSGIGIIIKII